MRVKRPASKHQLADLWNDEYAYTNHCIICGNSGRIDTSGKVFTAAGTECGGVAFCICPNGRVLRRVAKKPLYVIMGIPKRRMS